MTRESVENLEVIKPIVALVCAYDRLGNNSKSSRIFGIIRDIWFILSSKQWRSLRDLIAKIRTLLILRNSNFDLGFYRLQLNEDERKRPAHAHFILYGHTQGLDPEPGFSTRAYLERYPDIAGSGVNSYAHFIKHGRAEGRVSAVSGQLSTFVNLLMEGNQSAQSTPLYRAVARILGLEPDADKMVHWPRLLNKEKRLLAFEVRPDDRVLDAISTGAALLAQTRKYLSIKDYKRIRGILQKNEFTTFLHEKIIVSIAIPTYGNLDYTINCVESLLRLNSKFNFEVIIYDDAYIEDYSELFKDIKNLKYIRGIENLGFLKACNAASFESDSEYIVLLNNDVRVCDGWLDSLIETMQSDPSIALCGSKLFFEDGSLQEAGGIVWKDGSAWNYGRGDDPNKPEYAYARDVDYISGAAVCIRKTVWNKIGGFDQQFAPAYYEDTDIAFQLRAEGYRTVFQPLSKAIHYEGKSSGTDLTQGVKKYQSVNQKKFLEKWEHVLSTHADNGVDVIFEKDRLFKKRVVIVDSVTPSLNKDAGSNATIYLIKAYQNIGYKVIFIPEDNMLFIPGDTEFLQSIGVECLYFPYYSDAEIALKKVGEAVDIIHFIRPSTASRLLKNARKLRNSPRILYLNADLHYLRLGRQAELEGDKSLLATSIESKNVELSIAKQVDFNLVHSYAELEILKREGIQNVGYFPLVEAARTRSVSDTKKDIVFIGGFGHPPNVDAVKWFHDNVWNVLAETMPDVRMVVIGNNPPPDLIALSSTRFVITGFVSDLDPYLSRARVTVAPLRFGAGAKGKLITSMSFGVPVVASPVALEGLPLPDSMGIIPCHSPDDYLRQIEAYFSMSDEDYNSCSEALVAYVAASHSLRSAEIALLNAIG